MAESYPCESKVVTTICRGPQFCGALLCAAFEHRDQIFRPYILMSQLELLQLGRFFLELNCNVSGSIASEAEGFVYKSGSSVYPQKLQCL